MLFPTLEFALFFVVAFTGHWLLRPHPLPWRLFLLGMSLFFYAWWDVRFVALILGSVALNWSSAELLVRTRAPDGSPSPTSRWLIRFTVAANLALLGWFKYYGFFVTAASDALASVGISASPPVLSVTLPVGISFFTFQAMAYPLDVHRRAMGQMPLLDFAVFVTFFPQLVAGPIVRASEMAPQLAAPADPRDVAATEAFRLIFAGLFKKVVVSSFVAAAIVDEVFAAPNQYSGAEVALATYAYAIQIYADFSGYTDIAIGCALLLGFRFPQNFDAPYAATSLQDFWRRWHMTLSRWLRDYLYIPLGGNRSGRLMTYRNLVLTMLLGGLWHGAAWTFVIWGAIHGGGLALERWGRERLAGRQPALPEPLVRLIGWLVTFHVVCLAWIFFRAESLSLALEMLGRLAVGGVGPLVSAGLVLTVLAMLTAQFVPADWTKRAELLMGRAPWLVQGAALGVGLVIIDLLGPDGVAPFIYFQF